MEQETTENANSSTGETVEETKVESTTTDDSKEVTASEKKEYSETEKQLYARVKKLESKLESQPQSEETTDDFVKKSDLEAENEKLARQALSESDDPNDKAILENWDELAEVYSQVGRRGKNSKDSIVEDLRDSHLIWNRNRLPKESTKETEAAISQMNGTKAPSNKAPQVKDEGLKILKKNTKIENWFPKKED